MLRVGHTEKYQDGLAQPDVLAAAAHRLVQDKAPEHVRDNDAEVEYDRQRRDYAACKSYIADYLFCLIEILHG